MALDENSPKPQETTHRQLVIRKLKDGQVTDFYSLFKLAIFEAKVELNVNDPRFEQFLFAYQLLLGSAIATDEQSMNIFYKVLTSETQNLTLAQILIYALPPLRSLSIQQAVQAARMGARMTGMGA